MLFASFGSPSASRVERWGRGVLRSRYTPSDHASTPATNPLSLTPAYPAALPCRVLYDAYPDEVGPTANVIISDPDRRRELLLVARPVPPEVAEAHGGCLMCAPEDGSSLSEVQYFCLTDSDDAVYGRAAYIPLLCADDTTTSITLSEAEASPLVEERINCDEMVCSDSSESLGEPDTSELQPPSSCSEQK